MFADIANVICIRDALWRHKAMGCASIMVGAGFSRNAEPIGATARGMPAWAQMAEALCQPLYPTDDAGRQAALHEASGTSGFLRIAQEYQAAFGPSALNDRIRNLVPDVEYRPADLHRRLLRLPWADVFSTNWDTLLERGCSDVFERSYDVVRTVGDIPFTTRPRIVKLHGSFPGHDPFIFTEEDYRTYPTQFSPFVNLVQQSMMETIFCLVGFSGDDPNFLHWTGWVRDNLGPAAPKIYLVGWLELSVHRRRMLEARNVMPVDLSALPAGKDWPPDLRHRYATEWFLTALELGKPSPATSWPSPPRPPPPPPTHLGHVPTPDINVGPSRSPPPDYHQPAEARARSLWKAVQTWAFNRRRYPGWLVAPEHVREALWQELSWWLSEYAHVSFLTPVERLRALSELAWLMSCMLLPFPSEQEAQAYAALGSIDHANRTVGGEAVPNEISWPELLSGADDLALALARSARHQPDRSRFSRTLKFLEASALHQPQVRNAIIYEECLWDLAAGDLGGLSERLESWAPAPGDSIWNLRKAGLWSGLREDRRACVLLEATLVQIRRTRRRDLDDIVTLSLEGWALHLGLAYIDNISGRAAKFQKEVATPWERWRELSVLDCDANETRKALERTLDANKPPRPSVVKTRGFDLNRESVTHNLANGPSETVLAAYRMALAAEITGLPPKANNVTLLDRGLRAAARVLSNDEPWLASQLAIRLETAEKALEEVFSRTHVARLPEPLVETILDALTKRLAFGLGRLGGATDRVREAIDIVTSAIEILSRIAVRLPREALHDVFDTALTYFRSPLIRGWPHFFGSPMANLFKRVLDALAYDDIVARLPQLMALPMPCADDMPVSDLLWHDPALLLPDWFNLAPQRPESRRAEWTGIIADLLKAAGGSEPASREVAVSRLYKLHKWGLLKRSEKAAFARAVWAPEYREPSGLPGHTHLRSWVLVLLPQQHAGQARDALLRRVADLTTNTTVDLHTRIGEVGEVIRGLGQESAALELQPELRSALSSLINEWATLRAEHTHPIAFVMNQRQPTESEALQGVVEILPYLLPNDDLLEKVWFQAEAMDDAGDRGVSPAKLYPLLIRRWPERASILFDRIRRGLVSDQPEQVRMAVQGVFALVSNTDAHGSQMAIDDLVREVGIGVAARRASLLRQGLDLSRWIFRRGPRRLQDMIASDCDHGLTALLQEARYDRSEPAFDVPEIRASCFRLARAMAQAGHSDLRGVAGWLAAAAQDPLPEVRNAESRAASDGEQDS